MLLIIWSGLFKIVFLRILFYYFSMYNYWNGKFNISNVIKYFKFLNIFDVFSTRTILKDHEKAL